jgi:hypothetical protein
MVDEVEQQKQQKQQKQQRRPVRSGSRRIRAFFHPFDERGNLHSFYLLSCVTTCNEHAVLLLVSAINGADETARIFLSGKRPKQKLPIDHDFIRPARLRCRRGPYRV